jgi:hypothetical protein
MAGRIGIVSRLIAAFCCAPAWANNQPNSGADFP